MRRFPKENQRLYRTLYPRECAWPNHPAQFENGNRLSKRTAGRILWDGNSQPVSYKHLANARTSRRYFSMVFSLFSSSRKYFLKQSIASLVKIRPFISMYLRIYCIRKVWLGNCLSLWFSKDRCMLPWNKRFCKSKFHWKRKFVKDEYLNSFF